MQSGLATEQAKDLLIKHGRNRIDSHSTYSVVKNFISQFTTVINAILLVAAVFSYFIHNALDAALGAQRNGSDVLAEECS